MLSTSMPSSSAAEVKGSIDVHSSANALVTNNYQATNIPGWIFFKLSPANNLFSFGFLSILIAVDFRRRSRTFNVIKISKN